MACICGLDIGGGIYALCSSSVTELGTMFPIAGGWYACSHRAFGEKIGFVVGCCDWTVQSLANAYLAVAFGEFAAGLFPGLAGHVQLLGVAALASAAFLIGSVIGDLKHSLFTVILIVVSYAASRLIVRRRRAGKLTVGEA